MREAGNGEQGAGSGELLQYPGQRGCQLFALAKAVPTTLKGL
ncbi:MAG: hypothetical protein WC952_03655 [Desulfobulbaceae bacterium]